MNKTVFTRLLVGLFFLGAVLFLFIFPGMRSASGPEEAARACARLAEQERVRCFDALARESVARADDAADVQTLCERIGNATDEGRFIDCVMSSAVAAYRDGMTDLAYESCDLLAGYQGETWTCLNLLVVEDMLRKEPDS